MENLAALEQTFDELHRIAKGVTASDLGRPTPCREWDVQALLDHTFTVVAGLGAAVAGQAAAPVVADGADPAAQFRALADTALAAWRAPGALDREITGGAGPMPASTYAGINVLDTLGHTWDLATATGQDPTLPTELAEHTLGLCRAIITPETRSRAGFDDPVELPAGAGATEQLVAFLGRRP